MRRVHRLAAATAAAAAVWSAALRATAPPDGSSSPAPRPARTALLWAPAGALMLLGLYMLAQLVWGVATFRSCPEAADELREDIVRARQLLAKRGFRPRTPE